MTKGSTKAVICSSVSSNQARTYTTTWSFKLLFMRITMIMLCGNTTQS